MLTQREREQFLEVNRDKIVNRLKRDFARLGDQVEDMVHGAVYAASFQEFSSEAGFMAYLIEKATFIAIDYLELEIERRKARKGLPKRRRERDPMKKIDQKIDLERAIAQSTTNGRLRAALWHYLYEGYTQEEVGAWLGTTARWISYAAEDVNTIMRQKGY